MLVTNEITSNGKTEVNIKMWAKNLKRDVVALWLSANKADGPATAHNRTLNEWQLLTDAPNRTDDRNVVVSRPSAIATLLWSPDRQLLHPEVEKLPFPARSHLAARYLW